MINREVMSIGIKYFEGLKYKGMGGVEFKFDERDRQYKLIEMNPRTGMQNINATASGINFALIRYLDALGKEFDKPPAQINGVRWADAIADFKSFLIRRKRENAVSILAFMKDWLTADTHAFYAIDDPLPLIIRSGFGINIINEIISMSKNGR
jgi:predicted ATP-grasp superfamily ATP-dependent carboligase